MDDELNNSLIELSQNIQAISITVAEELNDNLEQFVDNGVRQLWKLTDLYAQCFRRNGVKTRSELENVIHACCRSEVVKLFGELCLLEDALNNKLTSADEFLQTDMHVIPLNIGDMYTSETNFFTLDSNENINVKNVLTADLNYFIFLRHFS